MGHVRIRAIHREIPSWDGPCDRPRAARVPGRARARNYPESGRSELGIDLALVLVIMFEALFSLLGPVGTATVLFGMLTTTAATFGVVAKSPRRAARI